ncbi:MAG: thermonuclease family protein [Magnetospirillum sp. WYHS-4]
MPNGKRHMRLQFEDHGQDFLWWEVMDGEVIDSAPCQAWAWVGTDLLDDHVVPGQKIMIRFRPDDPAVLLRYPIARIKYLDRPAPSGRPRRAALAGARTALAAVMLWIYAGSAAAWPVYEATVTGVIDGDTIAIDAPVWPGVVARDRLRVAGVDTPELHGKCSAEKAAARDATALVKMLVPAGARVSIHLDGQDKYGRLLGRVILPDGRELADVLIAAGLARRYDGGARQPWCAGEK